MKICAVEGCEKNSGRGKMCGMHRSRLRRRGTTSDLEPRSCDYCSKIYQPGKSNSKTCSDKCHQAFWRSNNREYNISRVTKWNQSNKEKRVANASRYFLKRKSLLSGKSTFDFSESKREKIFNKSGNRCFYCGELSQDLTLDHVIPVSRGGGNGEGNAVPCCRSCNSSKKDKFIIEWRMYINAAKFEKKTWAWSSREAIPAG